MIPPGEKQAQFSLQSGLPVDVAELLGAFTRWCLNKKQSCLNSY